MPIDSITHMTFTCQEKISKKRTQCSHKTKGAVYMEFGEKLKNVRKKRNMTQQELAKATGVSKRTIQFYENNKRYPRKRKFYYQIAEIFDVDVNCFLNDDEEFLLESGEQFGRRGQIQAQQVLEQASALFAGGELSEEDQIIFLNEIQQLYLDSKGRSRDKFTPNKFRIQGSTN